MNDLHAPIFSGARLHGARHDLRQVAFALRFVLEMAGSGRRLERVDAMRMRLRIYRDGLSWSCPALGDNDALRTTITAALGAAEDVLAHKERLATPRHIQLLSDALEAIGSQLERFDERAG